MDGQITIIKRDTIPPVEMAGAQGSPSGLGERRDFRWNDELRRFMPGATELSVSWIQLAPGEEMPSRKLNADSLTIVYAGSGQIVGNALLEVSAEDVVVVPSGCEHRFLAGSQGLSALSLQVGEDAQGLLSGATEAARAELDELKEINAKRAEAFERRSLFELLTSRDTDIASRALAQHLLSVWCSRCDTLLVVRQAACNDPKYAQVFNREAAAHRDRGVKPAPELEQTFVDPILAAFADWFTRQMYVLDNAEKLSLVHFALAPANAALGLVDAGCAHWCNRPDVGANEILLRSLTAKDFERLRVLLSEAWDMIEAMSDRLVLLAESAAPARHPQG